jgi:hypothetical protein
MWLPVALNKPVYLLNILTQLIFHGLLTIAVLGQSASKSVWQCRSIQTVDVASWNRPSERYVFYFFTDSVTTRAIQPLVFTFINFHCCSVVSFLHTT